MVLGSTGHWARQSCLRHTTRGRLEEQLAWIMLLYISAVFRDAILPKHLLYTHMLNLKFGYNAFSRASCCAVHLKESEGDRCSCLTSPQHQKIISLTQHIRLHIYISKSASQLIHDASALLAAQASSHMPLNRQQECKQTDFASRTFYRWMPVAAISTFNALVYPKSSRKHTHIADQHD